MLGAVVIVIALVLVLPPMFLMGGALLSAIFGWVLKDDAEDRYEGTEYVELYY